MRKALNNPIVVGILCVVALICVYWRASAPPAYLTVVDAGVVVEDPVIDHEPEPEPEPLPPVSPQPPPLPVPVRVAEATSPPSFSSKEILAQWEQAFSRDPFQIVVGAMSSGTETSRPGETNTAADSLPPRKAFHLQAVSVEGDKRFAVINHQVVAEGEKFDGFKVVRIHADGVVFSDRLGEHQLGFGGERKEEAS